MKIIRSSKLWSKISEYIFSKARNSRYGIISLSITILYSFVFYAHLSMHRAKISSEEMPILLLILNFLQSFLPLIFKLNVLVLHALPVHWVITVLLFVKRYNWSALTLGSCLDRVTVQFVHWHVIEPAYRALERTCQVVSRCALCEVLRQYWSCLFCYWWWLCLSACTCQLSKAVV